MGVMCTVCTCDLPESVNYNQPFFPGSRLVFSSYLKSWSRKKCFAVGLLLVLAGASITSASSAADRRSTPDRTLRCYVCGGVTGLPCEDIISTRRSPYRRPSPQLTSDGRKQIENCTDLINNKACIKQVVNGGTWNINGWGAKSS